MRTKTSDLIGSALDWAVAKCEGATDIRRNPHKFDQQFVVTDKTGRVVFLSGLKYSTNWAQGGPIIERERMKLDPYPMDWEAQSSGPKGLIRCGITPLIAAMRCYVASKLGDEVEVPDELI